MDITQEIKDLLGLKEIDKDRRYWMVRTKGGLYFDDFYFEGYIAINWNKINDLSTMNDKDVLKDKIIEEYPDENRPGLIANQIIRFVNEMKKGDVVLVPNKDSKFVAFGEILEDDIYFEEIENSDIVENIDNKSDVDENMDEEYVDEVCIFVKRRKIRWLKTIKRSKVDPYLERVLHSHNTISDADKYAHYIDRSMHPLYIKNNNLHMTFEVEQKENIPAIELINGINTIISGVDVINNILETDFKKSDIDLKLNIQSPGPLEFIYNNAELGILIGLLTATVVGAKFKFSFTKEEKSGEIESTGLFGRLLEFLQQKHNNKMELLEFQSKLVESRENLKMKMPQELINKSSSKE